MIPFKVSPTLINVNVNMVGHTQELGAQDISWGHTWTPLYLRFTFLFAFWFFV